MLLLLRLLRRRLLLLPLYTSRPRATRNGSSFAVLGLACRELPTTAPPSVLSCPDRPAARVARMLSAIASHSLQQNDDARLTSRWTKRRIAGALGPCGLSHAAGGAARAVAAPSAAAAARSTVLLRIRLTRRIGPAVISRLSRVTSMVKLGEEVDVGAAAVSNGIRDSIPHGPDYI